MKQRAAYHPPRPVGLVALALVALVALAACSPSDRPKVLSADHPIDRVVVRGDVFVVHPVEGVDLETLVDLSLFAGFRPGMTPEEAREEIGPPDHAQGRRYSSYERPQGTIRVTSVGRSPELPDHRRFHLRLEPADPDLASIFHPEIVRRIPRWQLGNRAVIIVGHDRLSVLTALMKNRRVWAVDWGRPEL